MVSGEYWFKDLLKLEKRVLASGGGAPAADVYTINGQPGPLYNCSKNGKVLRSTSYASKFLLISLDARETINLFLPVIT